MWTDAVQLCSRHIHESVAEVEAVVTSRLMKINRFQAAAEIHASLNNREVCHPFLSPCTRNHSEYDLQGVVQTYCLGGMFDQARDACGSNAKLQEFVKDFHQKQLSQDEDVEGLLQQGHTEQVKLLQPKST